MKIGLLHTTIRGDEKLLIKAAKKLNIELDIVDIRKLVFSPDTYKPIFDLVLDRSVSTMKGAQAMHFFEAQTIPVVNNSKVASICENKFATSLALKKAGVPTPNFAMAFSEAGAKKAVEYLGGFPVVIKPISGSWGRLAARVNDEDALEAILEHKEVLGSPNQKVFYLQEYIDKPGRDIRVTTIGDKVVCAIYRQTDHWVTNTARGAQAKRCRVDEELTKISLKAAKAVGGGVLGVDVFEVKNGYVINEVNHTTEFKNVQKVTGVDVANKILIYCKKIAKDAK